MTGVELPNYSGIFEFAIYTIVCFCLICVFTPAGKDGKLAAILNLFSFRRKNVVGKFSNLTFGWKNKKRSLSNARKLIRTQYGTPMPKPNCGYIRAGEWFCNCGKSKCKAFGEFRDAIEAIEAPDVTTPVHPKTDRRAAIEHSRNK